MTLFPGGRRVQTHSPPCTGRETPRPRRALYYARPQDCQDGSLGSVDNRGPGSSCPQRNVYPKLALSAHVYLRMPKSLSGSIRLDHASLRSGDRCSRGLEAHAQPRHPAGPQLPRVGGPDVERLHGPPRPVAPMTRSQARRSPKHTTQRPTPSPATDRKGAHDEALASGHILIRS